MNSQLGRYQEAESQFSQCTNYGLHVPDVWGYLALVNLKMNKTFRALESWKYAKLVSFQCDFAKFIYNLFIFSVP